MHFKKFNKLTRIIKIIKIIKVSNKMARATLGADDLGDNRTQGHPKVSMRPLSPKQSVVVVVAAAMILCIGLTKYCNFVNYISLTSCIVKTCCNQNGRGANYEKPQIFKITLDRRTKILHVKAITRATPAATFITLIV